jgi:hypothetical protein
MHRQIWQVLAKSVNFGWFATSLLLSVLSIWANIWLLCFTHAIEWKITKACHKS